MESLSDIVHHIDTLVEEDGGGAENVSLQRVKMTVLHMIDSYGLRVDQLEVVKNFENNVSTRYISPSLINVIIGDFECYDLTCSRDNLIIRSALENLIKFNINLLDENKIQEEVIKKLKSNDIKIDRPSSEKKIVRYIHYTNWFLHSVAEFERCGMITIYSLLVRMTQKNYLNTMIEIKRLLKEDYMYPRFQHLQYMHSVEFVGFDYVDSIH
jgi:hypothetical protein